MNNASLELGGTNWAEKDASLLGYTVSDDSGRFSPQEFTFARGSNLAATRIGKTGIIEKGRENLLVQSNSFDTWSFTSGSSVTANQAGYDGTNDAWLLTDSGDTSSYAIYRNFNDVGVLTSSIYAKAASTNEIELDFFGSPSAYVQVNLTTGSITNALNHIDAQSVSVGNGWWRISVTGNLSSTSYVRIGCNGAGSIYIQDAQLEQGLAASPYIPTTTTTVQAGVLENTPRLNYTTGVANPYLLLEPSRTQLIPQSEYITGFGNATPTYNTTDTLSPEGLYNALKAEATGSLPRVRSQYTASDGVYTLSLFAKKGTSSYLRMRAYDGTDNHEATFDLNDGTYQYETTGVTAHSEDYGNGWYRCAITYTSGVSDTGLNFAQAITSAGSTGNVYTYGYQAEAGSYPTSYIPTYSVSATRAADSCIKTNASGEIGQTEGTMFVDFTFNGNPTSIDYSIMILGAIGSNYITIGAYNTSLYSRVFNSTMQVNINALQLVKGTRYKVALAYANNDVVMYVNGVNRGSDTSVSIPAVSQIGFTRPTYEASTDILNSQVYKERLTNAELITLTTI